MTNQLPKGKSFSKKMTYSLVSIGLALVLGVLFLVFSGDNTKSTSTKKENNDSSLAAAKIAELNAENFNPLLLKGSRTKIADQSFNILQDSQTLTFDKNSPYHVGDFVMKDGKLYRIGADGKLHLFTGKLKNGDVVWKDGKRYIWQDGKLVPADGLSADSTSPYHVGDFVMKDGKLYRIGADGKLHLYKGKLKNGDVVWKDGKRYIWQDGKLVPADGLGADNASPYHVGDFVMKDGKLYRVGKDGKLHLYKGKLKEGDIVWKDGKAYVVGKDGKLHLLHDGDIVMKDGKPYIWKDGKLVPLSSIGVRAGAFVMKDGKLYQMGKDGKLHLYPDKLKAGDSVWKNGKLYVMGKDGKLHLYQNDSLMVVDGKVYRVEDGNLVLDKQSCVVTVIKNKRYVSDSDGTLIPFNEGDECIRSNGTKIVLAGNQIINIPAPKKPSKTQALWTVDMSKSSTDAMQAPLVVIHGDSKTTGSSGSSGSSAKGFAPKYNPLMPSIAGQADNYAIQNGQSNKLAFMKNNNKTTSGTLNSRQERNKYTYAISAGSIIPATLKTGINTDLPGPITAQVSQNVYDSRSGHFLLIPQGTVIFGMYDSKVSYGQSRVLMAWQRLEFPNGDSYDLQGMPGVDLAGYSGLHDKLNNHYFKIFGSALLFSVFGAVSQMTQPSNSSGGGPTNQQIVYSAIGQQMTQVSSQQIQKNMAIQPTIEIRPGDNFNILVTRSMVFDGAYQFDKGV